jgi:hypothetical protein
MPITRILRLFFCPGMGKVIRPTRITRTGALTNMGSLAR